MKDKNRYHLLIDDGGGKCVCIIKAQNGSNFTDEQKQKLEEIYGDYIVTSINNLSLNCYPRLDIIEDIDEWIKNNGK